jgi:hypothetical protein
MDDRVVSKLASNPEAVRAEAETIKERLADRLTKWQFKFLTELETTGFLPRRFWEAFYDLQTRSSRKKVVGRYRAFTLLEKLHHARPDLNDDDAEEFVKEMLGYGPEVAFSEGQWKYLFALCRKVYLMEDEYIEFG